MKSQKLLLRAIQGRSLRFQEIVLLATAMGFVLSRVVGSHHIFIHPDVPELLNIQNADGEAKPYQVRQFLNLVERYNLHLSDDE